MAGPTVLAIEDEALILTAIQDALTDGGYVVIACSAAGDAVTREIQKRYLLQREHPTLDPYKMHYL